MEAKKGYGKRWAIMLMAMLVAGPTEAYAASADETAKTRSVVVTATKTEQDIKDVPAAVTVITAEELAARGVVTLQQALESATSVYSGKDSHSRAMVGMRGFDTRHTLILIDGKRLISEVGSETTYELTRITMENVERIEIVRGPVSALYGSDAMGGVVNIITRQPEKAQMELRLEGKKYNAQSGGGYDWFARYDAGKQGRFAWSASLGENNIDPFNLSDGTTPNYYGYVRPYNFKGVLDVGKTGKLTLDLDRMEEKIERRSSATSLLKYDNTRSSVSLAFEDKLKNGSNFFRFFRSEYDKDYESRNRTTGKLTAFDLIERKSTLLEAKGTREWNKNHLLTFGGEYQQENFRGTRFNTGQGYYTVSRAGLTNTGTEGTIRYYAGYLQDEWSLSDKLLLTPAIRFDGSDAYTNAVSPKLGLTYKIKPNLRIKMSAGFGFKTPSLLNSYYGFWHNTATTAKPTSGLYMLGNPDLKPERSQSYEIGIEGENGPTSAKVTLFHNVITDMIESYDTGKTRDTTALLGFTSSDRIYTYRNIAQGSIWGLEGEIERKLNERFSLSVGYTYLDATDGSTGARLSDRPVHQLNGGISYTDKQRGITGRFWGTAISNVIATTASKAQKSYGTWNVLLSKDIDKNLTIYAGIENIFNFYDVDLKIFGAVYKTGIRIKF
jgi:outer membrane receptor for ferrienterochelin and colicins